MNADKNGVVGGGWSVSRAGVVAGLQIHSLALATNLEKVFRWSGQLKLVSTATGTASLTVNIGGLIFSFPTVAIVVGTQYLSFELSITTTNVNNVGFGSVKQSIALAGVAAAVNQASYSAISGSVIGGVSQWSFKSPTTTAVTVNSSIIEVF